MANQTMCKRLLNLIQAENIDTLFGILDPSETKKSLMERMPAALEPIHAGRLAIEATKMLPEDTILVRDGGAASMWFSALLRRTPRISMWSSNWRAIGNDLPMALGAQFAVGKNWRIVLLTGDVPAAAASVSPATCG